MTRIMDVLAARMDRIRKGDKGFTLIELLVVVIIIGILAAIAVPVYIGVQNNAKDSAVKSDLGNAKTAVIAYFSSNPSATSVGTLDPKTNTQLAQAGLTQSTDNTGMSFVGTAPTSAAAPFCILGTSSTTKKFVVSNNGGVVEGSTC